MIAEWRILIKISLIRHSYVNVTPSLPEEFIFFGQPQTKVKR